MRAESHLAKGALYLCAIERTLAGLGVAAALVDWRGRVTVANAMALVRRREDLRRFQASVLDALRGHPSPFAVTPVEAPGQGRHFLLIERAGAPTASARVELARSRWCLTARQTEVLRELAEGRANKSIAAALGCTEATVEAHVTALLQKSGAESRAELIAIVWKFS